MDSVSVLTLKAAFDDEALLEALDFNFTPRLSLLKEVSPAATGRGLEGAATYPAQGPRKAVILDSEGKVHRTSFCLDKAYIPSGLDEVTVVVVIEESAVFLARCMYTNGLQIEKYQPQAVVTCRQARTGAVVARDTLLGGLPEACPATVDLFTGGVWTRLGAEVTKEQLLGKILTRLDQ